MNGVRRIFLVGPVFAGMAVAASLRPPEPKGEEIDGRLGARMERAFRDGVKGVDARNLAAVFTNRNETRLWQTEFWGKWMHSAVPLWRRTGDAMLKAKIDASVRDVLAAQLPDGYIGNYVAAKRGTGWDVWGNKYTLLGLLIYHEATGDTPALDGARRLADYLIAEVHRTGVPLHRRGNYRGMACSSVLEPMVWLARVTGESRYQAFAREIVQGIDDAPDGPQLVRKALDGVDVAQRFPFPDEETDAWYGWTNGMKAYEMMSCYQGLIEYARLTGETRFLVAARAAAENIRWTEINLVGSGSSRECWYSGASRETEPARTTMETCVTITWMRLCGTLLEETGDPVYADEIEKSLYNAYLAALAVDTGRFQMYGALQGPRHRGCGQCGMDINCCSANGPRGFVTFLRDFILTDDRTVFVNFYAPSRVVARLVDGASVELRQTTDYPRDGTVRMDVRPASTSAAFALALRVPQWSARTTVKVNGTNAGPVVAGRYFILNRTWSPGDTVEIAFDLAPVTHFKNGHMAFTRGPVVLARDTRFGDGNPDEVVWPLKGLPAFRPVTSPDVSFDQVWSLQLETGLYRDWPVAKTISFCDFASAGNTWDEQSWLRVWLPVPIR